MEQASPGKRARSQTNSAEEADAASAADAAGNVEVSKADVSNLMGEELLRQQQPKGAAGVPDAAEV